MPTIKSRCNKLHIAPLKENQVASLLRRYRANLSEDVIKKIASISGGSIGKAISYVDGGALAIYDEIYALATSGKNFKTADMLSFCNNAVADDENYRLVKELILKFLSEQVRALNKVEETTDVYEKAVKTFKETEGLNLDRKQAIMTIMVAIYARITGLIAAVPIPTTNRATSINIREPARADRTFPRVNIAIPRSSVFLRPNTSPILPRMGAQAAVDIACARAVQVVLL